VHLRGGISIGEGSSGRTVSAYGGAGLSWRAAVGGIEQTDEPIVRSVRIRSARCRVRSICAWEAAERARALAEYERSR
jgi:hypothetical protein